MEVFVGTFFCWRAEEETPRATGKICRQGFSAGWGRLYKVTGKALRLPTVVPLKGGKPKMNRRGVIPCKGHETRSYSMQAHTACLSMVGQNIGCEKGLKAILVLPGLREGDSSMSPGIGPMAD